MRLSKIKLSGFKSFVDSTTISFPSNLMGIVGPNGCGKSNVIDAIRWVLGESSAKTLRGDSMADVIFNGSSGRKPVGQASIELTFDNSDGTITGSYAGYAEVGMRRVVARDGTSQYFLNNSRCRRKDITNLLLGTGIGTHGYSIIEQGMISRLVEAKPEELRAFLEEAAGISKYKERRRETEHRIRHTRDNLERLTDLRDELDKQLAHLQRQAKAAERYKVLKSEERRVEAELLVLRLNGLRTELESREQDLKSRQLQLEAAVTEQGAVEADIEKLRVELAERNEEFGRVQGVYYRVGADIARLEQSIQHRKSNIKRQTADIEATDQQLDEIGGHIDNDRVELEQLEALLSRLNPELEAANDQLRASEAALRQAEAEMEQHRDRWDHVNQAISDWERTAQVEETRIEQLTARLERLIKEKAEQEGALSELDFAQLEQGVDALIAAEEQQKNAAADAQRSLESVWEEIRDLRSREANVSSSLDRLRDQLQRDRGRLSSLEALQEAALGKMSAQVDEWLVQRNLDSQPRLASKLQVESGWERAVEIALGGYLHAVDVANIDEFVDDIAGLTDGGLAMLEQNPQFGPTGGSELAPLAQKIHAPASARSVVGGVFAANSVAEAIRLRHRLDDGHAIVTPEGVWVSRFAVRMNRGDDPQVGVIRRGEEIERLRLDVAQSTEASETSARELGEIRSRLEEMEAKRETRQVECTELQQTYAETRSRLEAARISLADARRRASGLQQGIAALVDEHDAIERAIHQGRDTLASAVLKRDELAVEHDVLDRSREQYSERLLAVRERAEQDREQVKQIAIMVESRRSSKESASAALARVQSQFQYLQERRAQLSTQVEEVSAPLDEEQAALERQLDERLRVEQELATARSAVEDCEGQLRQSEEDRLACQRKVNTAREDADAVRLSVRETQVRADTVAEQFARTEFELEALRSELPDDADVGAWSEKLDSVGRRIQRLGAINLAAIDEFEEQSERKQYLDRQYEDLTGALETLEAAIRKIDRETRTRFKETFDKANSGLGRLFPRLFGGGHAYLELDSDDLLTTGVTVMARPPGKKISTIHLLSGGEKALTAVALVFSIFELNPAPFCLLDEVDAPLDDANVGRFSEIVREMSDQVQFVIITHNKTTMEAMHQLAGVTMHEPGVSRLVAVDIDEAVKLAAM